MPDYVLGGPKKALLGVARKGVRFSQTTVSNTFKNGPLAGRTIGGLPEFAKRFNARTLMNVKDGWQEEFMLIMSNLNTRIVVNLSSLEGSSLQAVQKALSGRHVLPFDWDLQQIWQNPQWWDRIKFFKDGVEVINPFK